ncbi:MAG TPA: IPT/TIG domain-containing protein [Polyangiaceae bacterium]
MANRSPVTAIATAVAAAFVAFGYTAKVTTCGWRQRFEQLNQGPGGANRVAFMPGRANGDDGTLEQPRKVSSNPRDLRQWNRILTMSVWGADATNKDNEAAQIEAAEALLEQAWQGLYRAVDPATGTPLGLGNLRSGCSVKWTVDNTDFYFGRELLVEIPITGRLLDIAYGVAFPSGVVSRGAPFAFTSATSVPHTGGTTTITGTGFSRDAFAVIGQGDVATVLSTTFVSDTELTAVAPAYPAGSVDLTIVQRGLARLAPNGLTFT